MDDYLNIFFTVADKLKEMNIEVSDGLLPSLLECYENFRCAIEAQDDLLMPNGLKIKLLEQFQARKCKGYLEHPNAYYHVESERNLQEQKKNDKQRFYFNRNVSAEKSYRTLKSATGVLK